MQLSKGDAWALPQLLWASWCSHWFLLTLRLDGLYLGVSDDEYIQILMSRLMPLSGGYVSSEA